MSEIKTWYYRVPEECEGSYYPIKISNRAATDIKILFEEENESNPLQVNDLWKEGFTPLSFQSHAARILEDMIESAAKERHEWDSEDFEGEDHEYVISIHEEEDGPEIARGSAFASIEITWSCR